MKKKILNVLTILFLLVMIISFISLIQWNNENKKVKKIVTEVEHYIVTEEDIMKPEIKEVNDDIIGWLKVDYTNINYPVVQGQDNKYYLNHDLKGEYNTAGWIFMDSDNSLDDQNLIIYGHHRTDGSMFGSLDNLLKGHESGQIQLILEDKTINYSIISIYKTDKKDHYRDRNFKDLKETIQKFKTKSLVDFVVPIEEENQLITLSTCSNDNIGRIVVHGIKNI